MFPLIISKYNMTALERLLESIQSLRQQITQVEEQFYHNLAFLWSSAEKPAQELTALTFINVILIIPSGFYRGHFAFRVLMQPQNTFFSSVLFPHLIF